MLTLKGTTLLRAPRGTLMVSVENGHKVVLRRSRKCEKFVTYRHLAQVNKQKRCHTNII